MGLLPLGVFYLQERLAVGGSADVWRAVHPSSSLAVAIKLLREPIDRDAVAREARAVATLLHPAVVRIVDQGEVRTSIARSRPEALTPRQPYLVMELGEATLWARPPRPGWRTLRGVLGSLLDGLAHAHARRVVHCDLKPSNVLWVRRGHAPATLAIADFGLAKLTVKDGRVGAGTPRYMAPEQREDAYEIGPWTDLYALGTMARELAYCELGEARFELPAGFDAWLERLTDPAIAFRLQSAAEARYALGALADVPEPVDIAAIAPIWSDADVTRELATKPPSPLLRPERPRDEPTHSTVVPSAEWVAAITETFEPLTWPTVTEPAPPPLRRPLPASWREPIELGPIHVVGAGLGLYGFRALPLVGREAERDELWRLLRQVVDGDEARPRAVFLTGAAGVGKTTLAEWLVRRAVEVIGVEPTRVRIREGERPGDALLCAAREWLGCGHVVEPDDVREAIRRVLPRLVGGVDPAELEALTRVNSLRGMDPMPTATERRGVAVRFFAKSSLRRPILLLLDGLHWDELTVRFVEDLLRMRGRFMVVATVGLDEGMDLPERLSAILRHDAVYEVPVEPLPPAYHRRLVRELLGLSDQLAERVEQRTTGNPMFAVQLVGDWVSRGLLTVEKGALSLPADEEEALPDDLHALWTRRIARLTEGGAADRVALELAAILGAEVDVGHWRAATRTMGIPLDERLLKRLLRSHLVLANAAGTELRFAHGMIRESLLRTARDAGREAALHSAAADALRPLYDKGARALAGALALHLQRALRGAEALEVMVEVIRQTITGGRFEDALAQLDDAEALREELGQGADERAACEAAVLRATALNRMGRLDQAAMSAGKALAMSGGESTWRDMEALALHELGYTDYHRGKSDLALSHLSRAVELMEELGSHGPLARCLRVRGDLAHGRGDFDAARADFERALAVSTAVGDRASVASSLLGLSLPGVGDPSRAEDARKLFEELGHCSGACTALNTLGEVARRDGRLEEAEDLYRRGRRWAQMGGVSQHEHICGVNLALTMLAAERYDAAFVETELGARMTRLLGQRLVSYMHEVVAVAAALGAGREAEARQHLENAIELQDRVDHADQDVAWAARRACELALGRDRVELAEEIFELARVEHLRLGDENALAELEARVLRAREMTDGPSSGV